MNIRSAIATIQSDLRHFGLLHTAYDLVVRLVNRIVFSKSLRVVALSELTREDPLPPNFHFRAISLEELAGLAQMPEYGLNPILLEEVRRDSENSCFGIYDGEKLANYLFMFAGPTLMADDLEVTFGSGYAYLCATFTHPDYRGLHMNSIGVGLAAREYKQRGFQELLAYVESNNFSSLRSLQRIGWKRIGTIHIVRVFGRYFIRTGRGCIPYGFRVMPVPKRTATICHPRQEIRRKPVKTSGRKFINMLSIERITTVDQVAAMQPEWDALLRRSRSNCVFLTHEWLSTWWKHLAEGRKLHILTARENGHLVGILPLALRPPQYARMTPRTLEFLGCGVIGSDYLDVIADSDKEDDVLDAFAHHLGACGFMLQLGQLARENCLAHSLATRLSGRNWIVSETRINECPIIPLAGHSWETYLEDLGSSQRYNFNRRLRNLEKIEGFRIERETSLDVVIDLHKKRWSERGGLSEAFQSDDIIAFHQEFVQLAARRGWLRLLSLWIKDQPAAAIYGLHYGSKFCFYQSGFDPAFNKQSVGLVIMGLSIKMALEEGATEYDLLHGCEEYKFRWAREKRELGRIELFPPFLRGAFYKRCLTFNRAARRLVRQTLNRAA